MEKQPIFKPSQFIWILCIAILSLLGACQRQEEILDDQDEKCRQITINKPLFSNNGDEFAFEDISISQDCLSIKIRYGGGCGTIKTYLVGEEKSDSNKSKMTLKFLLEDNDPCEAYIATEASFDLKTIRNPNHSELTIHIIGWPDVITYTY